MIGKNILPRRDFLRNAAMLAGAGVTAPLWAAMKYDRDAVLRYFRARAKETDARVKARVAHQLRARRGRRAAGVPRLPRNV